MKIKKLGALLVSVALCAGMAAPAFAYGGEPVEEVEQPVLTSTTDEEDVVTVTDEETGALTPEGNLTLVDDYHTDYSDGSGQQFITLVSKSGATFYLVIDRNAKGQQTVHFMNLVDEADLLALMEEDAAKAANQRGGEGRTLSDKIRKYVLPNLPYLFVFWFFSKIGTAYRIAPGTDFGTKLMGMLDTFPKAFETYWPGLGGIDLLVGLAGAAGVYLLIQSKIRQAKKFRRDAEYGTARFGTKEDIKPFVDPKFQNNVILTGTEFLTMNTRPKIPANARNLNACVIGSSGSGKTRFWLTPQLLQAHSSYVVVDPKGGTLDQCGRFLQREKYRVRVFNSIDFSKSMHYNPLAYIKTESDVLKFVTALIANTKGDGKEGDEFWTKAETLLYCALVAYIVFEGPEEERNMNTLVEMINSMEVREDDETFKNAVDYMFDGLERRSPQHFAVRQYKKYKLASGDICSK